MQAIPHYTNTGFQVVDYTGSVLVLPLQFSHFIAFKNSKEKQISEKDRLIQFM